MTSINNYGHSLSCVRMVILYPFKIMCFVKKVREVVFRSTGNGPQNEYDKNITYVNIILNYNNNS